MIDPESPPEAGAREASTGRCLPDRHTGDHERVAYAVVGLHERASNIGMAGDVDTPRRSADAALELVADHARAAADIALGHRAALRTVQRAIDVLCAHVKAVDVVQFAVPGLGDDRRRPPVTGRVGRTSANPPGDHRVVHDADAVRVGEHDRPVDLAHFVQVGRARHFAVAVQREPPSVDGTQQR